MHSFYTLYTLKFYLKNILLNNMAIKKKEIT